MAGKHPGQKTYVVEAPLAADADLGEPGMFDSWLANFDARLATLGERQDAFFEKMGIHVIERPEPAGVEAKSGR